MHATDFLTVDNCFTTVSYTFQHLYGGFLFPLSLQYLVNCIPLSSGHLLGCFVQQVLFVYFIVDLIISCYFFSIRADVRKSVSVYGQ